MSLPIAPFIPVPPADTQARAQIAREIAYIDKNIVQMMEWDSYFAAAKSPDVKRYQSAVRDIVSDLRVAQNELQAALKTISAVMYHTHRATAHFAFASAARRAEKLSADVDAYVRPKEIEERPDFMEPLSSPSSSPSRVTKRHAFVLNAGL